MQVVPRPSLQSGAKAIATGSWSVANANGFADVERIPLALAIDNLRRIVGATDLPVTIDLESGYGDVPEVVGETIALAIDAGAVGCNLEDSFPANGNSARQSISLIASGAPDRPPTQRISASSSMLGPMSFFSDRPNSMTML
jgi:2-methylisocitrate lyase-like PEP mutase family enzyme